MRTATAPAPPRAAAARWVLAPGCQVRRERFGLLFYDLRGPRLLFAASGDLLAPEALRAGTGLGEALRGRSTAERARVARLVAHLQAKGFLHEQPLR